MMRKTRKEQHFHQSSREFGQLEDSKGHRETRPVHFEKHEISSLGMRFSLKT